MSPPTRLRESSGMLAISSGAVLWGTTGVAVSIVADRSGRSPLVTGWYRVAIAAVVVALVLGRRGARRARAAFGRHPYALVACGIGFGFYQAAYFVGVENAGVSVSTLVSLGIAPVALTVVGAVRGGRAPTTGSLLVLGSAVLGLCLVSLSHGTADAPNPTLGVLASVASGLGYAATTLLSRRLSDEDPLVLTGVTSVVATVALLPLAIAAGIAPPHDVVANGWLLYIGVVPTVAAYWLFYRGLRTTASEIAGVLTLLEPLTAAALAALVLHEALPTSGLVGAALMLAAVGALYVRPPEPSATSDAELPAPPRP